MDDHTYASRMFSPRFAFINAWTDQDTVKFIYNRSLRHSTERFMRRQYLNTGGEGNVETLDNFEFRYERKQSENLGLVVSTYYNKMDAVSFTFDTDVSELLGELQFAGIELELQYETERSKLSLSHNFTKHLNFDLSNEKVARQNITASAYGIGNDLANWSNHVTKLVLERDLADSFIASASLRYYWGYPGGQDLSNYNNLVLDRDVRLPVTDGSKKAWQESVFLNLGVEHQLSDGSTIRLDAYNVLGWLDEDLNKRNDFQRSAQYRIEAPALAFTFKHKF